MKSLEIVNELIECFEDKVEFQKDFLKANPKEKPNPIFERQLNGCKQIKQDLEVLEILRKHIHLRRFENMNRNEVMISPLISENERDKLKQWLEVNE